MIQCPAKEKEAVLSYLEGRFGLSGNLFAAFSWYAGSKGRVFLGPAAPHVTSLSAGLGIARLSPTGAVKPSTTILQLFGQHITKNKVALSKEQAVLYLSGESFPIETPEEGYVLVIYNNIPLGCALLKAGRLKNMLPKARRSAVQFL